MKKFLVAVLIAFLYCTGTAIAYDVPKVSFAWDCNVEPDVAGYRLFARMNADPYDYTKPYEFTCTVVSGQCPTDPAKMVCEGSIDDLSAPDGVLTDFKFVARAFDTEGAESGDSNEVSLGVDRTALPTVTDFSGSYDKTTDQVTLSWKQSPAGRVTHWKVFVSDQTGGPYAELLQVDNSGSEDVTATTPITGTPPGQVTTKYFVVVGYAAWDIYSSNSAEVAVAIDKNLPPADVMNLRIPTSP